MTRVRLADGVVIVGVVGLGGEKFVTPSDVGRVDGQCVHMTNTTDHEIETFNTTADVAKPRTDDGGEILDPIILLRQKVSRCRLAVEVEAEALVDMTGSPFRLGRAVDALRAAREELAAAEAGK